MMCCFPSRPGRDGAQKDIRPAGEGAGAGPPGHAGALLEELAPAFRRRSAHALFMALACGMILASRRAVVAMAAAAGMAGQFRRACWFFSRAARDIDDLGVAVACLIVKYLLAEGEPVTVAVDGTFFRRWGKKAAQARWAYDGSAQGGKKIAFGNTWVIAAIVVRLPVCSSPVALPVLFRLWHGKGTASQVDLAAQMLTTMTAAFPGRIIHGAGDAAFHGQALICQTSTWTTRLPASAVLYGPRPAPAGKRGRPRAKGARPGTPAQIARRRQLADRRGRHLRQDPHGAGRGDRRAVARQLQKTPPASSCWSGIPVRISLMTWRCSPPAWPPPPPSSNGIPGGGRSSRPTPPEIRSSACERHTTGWRRPSSAPYRSASWSSRC